MTNSYCFAHFTFSQFRLRVDSYCEFASFETIPSILTVCQRRSRLRTNHAGENFKATPFMQ